MANRCAQFATVGFWRDCGCCRLLAVGAMGGLQQPARVHDRFLADAQVADAGDSCFDSADIQRTAVAYPMDRTAGFAAAGSIRRCDAWMAGIQEDESADARMALKDRSPVAIDLFDPSAVVAVLLGS
jgi:hypothetical protein